MQKFWWACNKYLAYGINVVLVSGLLGALVFFIWGLTQFAQS
jgi:uncharacterized membrane protein